MMPTGSTTTTGATTLTASVSSAPPGRASRTRQPGDLHHMSAPERALVPPTATPYAGEAGITRAPMTAVTRCPPSLERGPATHLMAPGEPHDRTCPSAPPPPSGPPG